MEGTHLHSLDAEPAEALAHLARRPGRERDREGATRIMSTGARSVGHAMRDRPRLAAAGPGPDDDGTLESLGDGALLGIEGDEGILHAGMVAPGSDVARDAPHERMGP